jgi:hypothetical protein
VAVSVWSCHVSQPKRTASTVLSFSTLVLLIARMCGRRRSVVKNSAWFSMYWKSAGMMPLPGSSVLL